MSDSREARILEAAIEVFLRYGFRRTTMGDIAEEAGISRPALYLDYKNKKEIFRAGMRQMVRDSEEQSDEALQNAEGLGERLWAVFGAWMVEPCKMIKSTPHAQELYEATHAFAEDLRKESLGIYERRLKKALETGGAKESAQGIPVADLARLLAISTFDLKRTASSVAALKRQLETAVRVHVELLGEG